MSLAFMADAPAAHAQSRQISTESVPIGLDAIRVHIYRPRTCQNRSGPLLFVFAGYERNAEDYLKRARRIARETCMTVFAPDLDSDRFPRARYQRGGISSPDNDSETCIGFLLRQLVNWARLHERRPDAPYILFGHSAGAQMLSRVTAFCPMPDARRIIIANPSSYVAPSLAERAPFGFKGILDVRDRESHLQRYLDQPITIYLGTSDTGDERLDEGPSARRQGRNRLERGQRIFLQAKDIAAKRDWPFRWRIVLAPGVGHSSKRMLRAPQMREALGD